jgi:thiol-disulfide isomerase/thioredoxin
MKTVVSLLAALLLIGAAAGASPSLDSVLGAQDWINGRATRGEVSGKVVVLDVFTVDCINCRNVVGSLRALYASQHRNGLEVIGIHTPETQPEQQRAYVAANLKEQGIVWPVAIDNAFHLWDAYGVNAWPTQLFFDRHGRLRKVIVGDSQDDAVRGEVEALLAER